MEDIKKREIRKAKREKRNCQQQENVDGKESGDERREVRNRRQFEARIRKQGNKRGGEGQRGVRVRLEEKNEEGKRGRRS